MAPGVFPENLRKSNQKPMCYNQTKFVKNELYMKRFHGNELKNLNSAFIREGKEYRNFETYVIFGPSRLKIP